MASVQGCRRSVLGFRFSNTPLLHKYVEQRRVMESPLPGGKPKPGHLGLDSLLSDYDIHLFMRVKRFSRNILIGSLIQMLSFSLEKWL